MKDTPKNPATSSSSSVGAGLRGVGGCRIAKEIPI